MSAPEHPSPPLVSAQEPKPAPIESEIEEVRAPSDAEVAGRPPSTKELTGFKAWWAKWGFEVKLLLALLLPVFVEVKNSLYSCPFVAAERDSSRGAAPRLWITLLLLVLSHRLLQHLTVWTFRYAKSLPTCRFVYQ
jgi:hypothetical protein